MGLVLVSCPAQCRAWAAELARGTSTGTARSNGRHGDGPQAARRTRLSRPMAAGALPDRWGRPYIYPTRVPLSRNLNPNSFPPSLDRLAAAALPSPLASPLLDLRWPRAAGGRHWQTARPSTTLISISNYNRRCSCILTLSSSSSPPTPSSSLSLSVSVAAGAPDLDPSRDHSASVRRHRRRRPQCSGCEGTKP